MDEDSSMARRAKGTGLHVRLDLERDCPELETELLKAIDGPFVPYFEEEMKAIGRRILSEKQRQQ